jgi:putative SOS response-associated peptidase YedK
MCGRFVEFSDTKKLKQYFSIDEVKCELVPDYNVAPSQEIAAIVRQNDSNVLGKLHWGLVPHWAKDISTGYKMINARVESVAAMPSFRHAFKRHRCLIPADGFYEWKKQERHKQPYCITK